MKNSSSLSLLAFVLALLGLLLWAWQSQLNAPTSVQKTAFSSNAAFATLTKLLREQVPHPTGSAANAVVRDRILGELKQSGYEPEVQSVFQCAPPDRSPGCTQIENIIAVYKGTGQGKAILATAHYDSVPAGPGVADDGAGVVVMLELARHLKTISPARNDVILLLTDGEETGLRGAIAFAERHPLMKNVGIVVNLESRGNTGPSVMFETGSGNAKLMALFEGAVPSSVSNSLAYEIYRLLPNDTDFSIYKRFDLTGFNFAMIGSASRYHTPKDDLSLLDINSLQHHGDNTFALMEKLLDADLSALNSKSDASYFDLFGQHLLVWPSALNFPISLFSVLAIFGLAFIHRSEVSISKLGWSVLGTIVALGLLFGLGWALSYPLGTWIEVHPLDHPEPWLARTALLAAALFVSSAIAILVADKSSAAAHAITVWLLLSMLAAVCAFYLPGASYALQWPALFFAVSGWAALRLRRIESLHVASLIGFILIAFFWLSHMLALDAVMGFNASQFKLLALAPFVLALTPLMMTTRNIPHALGASAGLLLVTTILASQAQGYSSDHPRPLNLIYYDNKDSGETRWLVSEEPGDEDFFAKAQFASQDESFKLGSLSDTKGRFRKATNENLPAPTFSISAPTHEDATTTLSGTLQAARIGFVIVIAVPGGSGIKSVSVEGQRVLGPEKLNAKLPAAARIFGVGNKPLKVEVKFNPSESANIVLIERSALPVSVETNELLKLRPENTSPVHSGDGSFVFKTIDLKALSPAAVPVPLP